MASDKQLIRYNYFTMISLFYVEWQSNSFHIDKMMRYVRCYIYCAICIQTERMGVNGQQPGLAALAYDASNSFCLVTYLFK